MLLYAAKVVFIKIQKPVGVFINKKTLAELELSAVISRQRGLKMERWSSKKVEALLKSLSHQGKAFPISESARRVKVKGYGHGYSTRGYFYIDMAYGGCKLAYMLPYSTGQHDVTSGYVSSGKLADRLEAMGTAGLAATYRQLEKHWKPAMKAQFDRRRAKGEE
jgi:hypothetical protein